MSWDAYIDNLIAQSKGADGSENVDRACIVGMDGGAPWTSAAHPSALKLQGPEGPNIARCFKSKDFTTFQSGGVRVEGTSYMFLREEDGKIVNAKKKGSGSLTMQCSSTAIVIGHCPEGGQAGKCNVAVGRIADYLSESGM
jgi:profilin